jgi:hypothetical protein
VVSVVRFPYGQIQHIKDEVFRFQTFSHNLINNLNGSSFAIENAFLYLINLPTFTKFNSNSKGLNCFLAVGPYNEYIKKILSVILI